MKYTLIYIYINKLNKNLVFVAKTHNYDIFVAKTRNYDIFVAKIYDYALIDSFWGFPGFIDSLKSYATLPTATVHTLHDVGGGGLTAPPESQTESYILVSVTHGKPCVNIGNFIRFFSKLTGSRPQWPKWPILDKNPNFWAWFSETSAPHQRLRFWVLSLRITENQQNAFWGWTLEYTWNFVQ